VARGADPDDRPGRRRGQHLGGTQRTLEVRAEPAKLVAHHVSFEELKTALERTVASQPGAALETGDRQLLLRASFLPKTGSELASALVGMKEGVAVRVGDVATIVEGAEPRLGAATRDGGGETVYVMVQILVGANARDVTRGVRAKLDEVRSALPEDVRLEVVYDRSELVNATLRTVGRSLLDGGLLVCAVLFLMLGSARAGFVVAITIPVAMIGSTAAMTLLGASGNLMSLGAVDFGLLVDGAVVLVEHVFHEHGDDAEGTWAEGVSRACAAVARPSFFGVAVILLVYVPVLSLTGVDGKLFRPMAVTVVLALVFALLFSLTFIPAATAQLLGPRDVPKQTPLVVRAIERVHGALLGRATKGAWLALTLAVAGLALALALFVVSRMGSELAPTLDDGALVIQTTRHPDIGIEGAIVQAGRLERALVGKVPEVRAVVSRVGSPAVATDVMGLEQADVFVELAPRASWRPGLTREGLLEELGRRFEDATPDSDPAFTQPIQMRFNELLGGAPFDVVVSILGQDLGALRRTSAEVLRVVSGIRGVEEPRVLAEDDTPLVQVTPSSLAAAQRGMRVGEVLDLVGGLRLGLEVGTTYDGPRQIPVRLRIGKDAPQPLGLERVLLPGPEGELVALEHLAKVERLEAPAVLFRHNGERRMLLVFNVRGRELGEVVEEARRLSLT